MEEIRRLVERVNAVTDEIMADPMAAERHGITIYRRSSLETTGADRLVCPTGNARGDALRSVASALLTRYDYVVAEDIDGSAHLIITGRA